MQVTRKGILKMKVEAEAWMGVANPALTMDEAVARLKALGNEILEVDAPGRRVKVMQASSEDRWACEYCGAHSKSYEVVEIHERSCPKKGEAPCQ